MKSFAVLVAVVVTACAGAGTPLSLREHATPPALSLSTDPAARRSFPQRVSPARLPSADRAGINGSLVAGVKLCVAPDGNVHSVAIESSSGSAALDRAIAADVPSWRYEPYRAPAGIKVCEQVTVAYRR